MQIPHPKLASLYAFWDSKRQGRLMPARSDVDVLELTGWLGNLMLVEVEGEAKGRLVFRYRVYGTRLAEYYGRDLTRRTVDDLPVEVRRQVSDEYEAVCKSCAPTLVTQQRTLNFRPAALLKLILPLSADGVTVDHILAGVYSAEE